MTDIFRKGWPYAASVLVLIAVLACWQWWAVANPTFFLPTPLTVGARVVKDWLSGPVTNLFVTDVALQAIRQTFASALSGWAIAAVVGVVVGAAMGTWRTVADVSNLPLLLLRSVPAVAVIPICIVLFGLGFEMKIIVVAFGAVWPTLINTMSGVRDIEKVQLDVARLYHLGPAARFWRVQLPAASPRIFAGLRVSMSMAIVIAVGAELLAGSGGLGGAALSAQASFDVPGLWATLFILAVFGLLVNGIFLIAERAALKWHSQRSAQ